MLVDACKEQFETEYQEQFHEIPVLIGESHGDERSTIVKTQRNRQSGRPVADTDARRIVIIGGGFGGVATARQLRRLSRRRRDLEIVLISESNYLLFTSMLPEVASGALKPEHICAPVRAYVPGIRFINATVTAIDTAARTVTCEHPAGLGAETIRWDQLVLAAGSVANFYGNDGIAAHALTLKTLADATRLRNQILTLLEQAENEIEPARRRALLTFVVAGGGFSGVETIAELADFCRSALRYFANLDPDDLRFELIEARSRILPEITADLAATALHVLERRGVMVRLGRRVADASADSLTLDDGSRIPAFTLIWTTGNRPSHLAGMLPAEPTPSGHLPTDTTMRVRGLDNVWALGDIARIPTGQTCGDYYPPTAQHAVRQGRHLAHNILATLTGRSPRPFRFRSLGTLVALGRRKGVAEIRGIHISGFPAWFIWRTVYLLKLPTLLNKVRVAIDWTIDLIFPRDIVITAEVTGARAIHEKERGNSPAAAR